MAKRLRFNPGNLDEKISFVKMGRGTDGRPIEETVLNTWAMVRLPSSIRADQAGELTIVREVVATIRVREGFTPTKDMTVKWRDNSYVISSLPPSLDKRYLQVRLVYED